MTADEAQRATLEKVRVLQRKLYRAAKAQPQRTFGVLFDKVCSLEVLWFAWEQVRRNRAEPRASMAKPSNRSRRGVRCGFFWNCGRN